MDKKIISLAEENSVGELVELLLTIDNEEVCFQWLDMSGLQIRVPTRTLFFLFLNQNICCGYSKELS